MKSVTTQIERERGAAYSCSQRAHFCWQDDTPIKLLNTQQSSKIVLRKCHQYNFGKGYLRPVKLLDVSFNGSQVGPLPLDPEIERVDSPESRKIRRPSLVSLPFSSEVRML